MYTQQSWFDFYFKGSFAHEFGHTGGLDDIRIMRGQIHKERLMYNGAPSFGKRSPDALNPFPKPHYKELRRLNFNGTSYYKVPKGVR